MTFSRDVESQTLSTFQKHRPSEYFSHLNGDAAFKEHNKKIDLLYRFGLCFPPEFFANKKLIDLGSGTGEHTVSLARWGANCTLVELNREALEVAQDVFRKHTTNFESHQFICSSLYDIDINKLQNSFDIAHSRGVFTHVSNKAYAFHLLARLAKPGGYVIYGDRNASGGIQEMLQRFAIYKLGGINDEKIVDVAESLFSFDIDRSQQAVPRTREAIIYDRWVIQQQDDPSAQDVLNMFEAEGLAYVSSWPRIDYAGRGLSIHTNPNSNAQLQHGALLAENLWMILRDDELEKINLQSGASNPIYFEELAKTASLLKNLQLSSALTTPELSDQFTNLKDSIDQSFSLGKSPLAIRLDAFTSEVLDFLSLVDTNSPLASIRNAIDDYEFLFKGYAGVRHVDYVAYKPA